MKLLGFLKNKTAKAETKEEKKNINAQADMELTDDALECVAGGVDPYQQKQLEFRDKELEKRRKQFQQRHQADKEKNKEMQKLNRLFR